ncbi:MAG: transposase, partial [Deltaproteobacteria bacterium]|nr:transposase [Deltaproteobacteria bacterium]
MERRKLFRDDKDRQSFLERLAVILEETQTQCYAWALIPNHFHLLLRTSLTPLSKVMRRLMTGYAVTFNKRHKRTGHLFQNRYKSVVCEEDPYLLELIRYIHLNPLRAGLVKDLQELDKYPWSGHSTILGHCKNPLAPEVRDQRSEVSNPIALGILSADLPASPESKGKKHPENPVNPVKDKSLAEKTIEDVLLHFGETQNVARRRYREFVEKGIGQGRRPELQGGGLVRSAGGNKAGLLGRLKEEREKGDARILGSGDFVTETLEQTEVKLEKKYLPKRPIEELVEGVAGKLGVKPEVICSGNKQRRYSEARSLVAFLAVEEVGHPAADVARFLGLTRMG